MTLFNEIQEADPLLIQLLFIVAAGALLVGLFIGLIKVIIKYSIIITLGIIVWIAWQNGVLG